MDRRISGKCRALAAGAVSVALLAVTGIMFWQEFRPGGASARSGGEYHLRDNRRLYDRRLLGRVTTFLMDVYKDRDGRSLPDFETPPPPGGAKIVLPALLREGTGEGGELRNGFGTNSLSTNATVEIRGVPTQNRKFHNFKIRLTRRSGQFEGQSILNFKKAWRTFCRVEEKFAFDLFSALDGILSLRTRFVRLLVRDMDSVEPGYDDYGLYTMLEQPDDHYFRARGMNDTGFLYQAENFDFRPRPEFVDTDTPSYSKAAFELLLDIKQGKSHEAFLEMLHAVNDPGIPAATLLDRYFDRDNLFTFLAVNVLLGNRNCVSEGYMIYCPGVPRRWYFIPSNMNGALPPNLDLDTADLLVEGPAMFWGNVLYERVLSEPENLSRLRARIRELMEFFSQEYVEGMTEQYIPVLERFFSVQPDRGSVRTGREEIIGRVRRFHAIMTENAAAFERNSVITPPPPRRVRLQSPEDGGSEVRFSWSRSRQPGSELFRYRVEIALDPAFGQIIATAETVNFREAVIRDLPPGRLFWRVRVEDAAGGVSGSRNVETLEDGSRLYGAASFRKL